MTAKLTVTAHLVHDGRSFSVTGKKAQTLFLLVDKGARGITAYDFRGGPPFRLGAYICELRHRFSIAIRTELEPHEGGRHARYFLETQIAIEPVAAAPESKAA